MGNVILIDFEPSSRWNFKELLEETTGESWEVKKEVSNIIQGGRIQTLKRYLKYFSFPFSVFSERKRYKKVLAWQQFFGILFAFYYRLFHVSGGPDLYVMTFIYKEKSGFVGKIYRCFIRYSLGAKCLKKLFVFSPSECDYYSKLLNVDISLFVSIDLGVEDYCKDYRFDLNSEKYYLSVGRSNRDYRYLIDNWNDSYGRLKIITDLLIDTDKESVSIIKNCYDQDYYDILKDCYALIVPLEDTNISSGELVTIQANMFGKPVIASYNITLRNYIEDGVNGYMCDKERFEEYMDILENKDTYRKMCFDSREFYMNRYSLENMTNEVAEFIKG